ncbi:MAG: amidohydrolase family protein [Candidatus Aminicenantes bacterium]|nr:amidohydrolase family protein [Candidatus Aminicenantes bacterium]
MTLYLKDATYVDWETLELKKTSIKVHRGPGGKIEFAPKFAEEETDTVLDCTGKLVMKSFACGHHHVYSALARGMGAPKRIPTNFHEVLQYVWWTLDKCLDLKMIEASALSTALYCAKNGLTFVIDHHASPFAIDNSLETIAAAFDKVGVSHLLCYELSDRDGLIPRQKGLEETENYLKNKNQGLVGLHASFTVGDHLLKQAVTLAEKYNSGIHVHAAEDQIDQDYCLRDHGKRVIQRFSRAGVLAFPKTILVHCLHLDPEERNLLQKSPVYVAQNTESNLNNNVGIFNSSGLGDNIMLGTDGMHGDMLRSAKAAYLVGQSVEPITTDGIYQRFRKVHHYLKENRFTGDGENNLAILDYDTPTEIRQNNFTGHFVYGIDSRHVESVISDGRLIVKNRKALTVEEDEILHFSREMGNKLWEKMRKL